MYVLGIKNYEVLNFRFRILSTHGAEHLSKYKEVTVIYRSLERVTEVYYKLLREKGNVSNNFIHLVV